MKSHAIRTARVPARLSHRRATRPALEHWLADADPARHGLPTQAIVLVRRLQAPWTALASPESNTRYGALASALAGAARPARGELHGDVVWFADEAELLACLARAVLAGELALHWWWKLVLRDLSPAAARTRWLESVQAAPQAVVRLPVSVSGRWLATWTASELRRLVQRLARVFPVAEEAVLAELVQADVAVPGDPQVAAHAPFGAVVPTIIAPGEGLRRLLFALAREPMALNEVQRVQATWHDAAHGMAFASPVVRAEAPAARPGAFVEEAPAAAALPELGSEIVVALVPPLMLSPSVAAVPALPAISALAAAEEHGPAAVEASVAPASEAIAEASWTEIPLPASLHTGFGGLLFLLNAALQLELYGDFTQPRLPRSLDCSPWRFLLACGRLYAGRAFADDALAAWLHARAPQRAAGARKRRPGLWRDLRERLALALGLDDATELVPALLRLPATIEDSSERVDLHMDLAALPLPVRLAGLDRDPGWIPAAGCDVRFHFH